MTAILHLIHWFKNRGTSYETLGLSGSDYARGYVQMWLREECIPEKSAQKIFGAADRILRAGRE